VDTTVADAIENSTMSSLKPTSARMKRASIVAPSIGHFIAPYGTCIASTTKTIQATKHPAIGVGGGTDRMGYRKDQKQLIVPLQDPLPAGTYTVTWNVVSVDTHRVNGTYSFKVEG